MPKHCIDSLSIRKDLQQQRHLGEATIILRKYGYPPDKQEKATLTVLEQAEVLSANWATAWGSASDEHLGFRFDDSGNVRGLELDYRGRDRLERKILELARHWAKPGPPVRVSFEEVRGLSVAKVVVPHGEALVYLINGGIYLRYDSSDVQAQPEDLARLVAEFES